MRVVHYMCIDPSRGKVADYDDDDAPLINVEFVNEANRLSEVEKMEIMELIAERLHKIWSS